MRSLPNIVITGTPGVGKTTICTQLIASASSTTPTPIILKHLSINALAKDRECHEGYDDDLQTHIVDEDKLLDEVEKELGITPDTPAGGDGGWIIDWHACDLFPVSWVDLVVVLRCEDTRVLYDRLKERNYAEKKLQENLDAEIFGVLAEEAREGFDEEAVVELKSEKAEDVDENCERILQWIERWMKDRKNEESHG